MYWCYLVHDVYVCRLRSERLLGTREELLRLRREDAVPLDDDDHGHGDQVRHSCDNAVGGHLRSSVLALDFGEPLQLLEELRVLGGVGAVGLHLGDDGGHQVVD